MSRERLADNRQLAFRERLRSKRSSPAAAEPEVWDMLSQGTPIVDGSTVENMLLGSPLSTRSRRRWMAVKAEWRSPVCATQPRTGRLPCVTSALSSLDKQQAESSDDKQ